MVEVIDEVDSEQGLRSVFDRVADLADLDAENEDEIFDENLDEEDEDFDED